MKIESLFLSVIIPTYNRPEQLVNCLQALSRLDFPGERFEVIVVDDGGGYSLKALLEPFHSLIDLKILKAKHGGPASARNIGTSIAKGDYLVFTDDDCEPSPHWLKNISALFLKRPDNAIGGKTINGLPDNIYAATSQLLISYLYEYYKAVTDYRRFFTSNNLAVPADGFHAIGGFDEKTFYHAAGEDRDFCYRWLQQGFPMIYDPNIIIYHSHRLNLLTFLKQHLNYGRGAFRFHHSRKRLNSEPMTIEPISFYINMLRFPYTDAQGKRLLQIQMLLILSQVLNTLGYFIEKFNFRHISYL